MHSDGPVLYPMRHSRNLRPSDPRNLFPNRIRSWSNRYHKNRVHRGCGKIHDTSPRLFPCLYQAVPAWWYRNRQLRRQTSAGQPYSRPKRVPSCVTRYRLYWPMLPDPAPGGRLQLRQPPRHCYCQNLQNLSKSGCWPPQRHHRQIAPILNWVRNNHADWAR